MDALSDHDYPVGSYQEWQREAVAADEERGGRSSSGTDSQRSRSRTPRSQRDPSASPSTSGRGSEEDTIPREEWFGGADVPPGPVAYEAGSSAQADPLKTRGS